ncbi:MAG: MFS transporter [Chloroflexi bacterium]|nr:MFS transporter [Chloroflexota bacterium]
MNLFASLFRPVIPVPDHYRSNFKRLYWDIAWFGLLAGGAASFITIYAARLGADPQMLGLLSAAPAIVNLIFALPAGRWLERHARGKPVFWTAIFSRLFYLTWVALPWIFRDSAQVWAIIIITFVMNIPGTALAVGFNTLFADAVPSEWRGYISGVRNAILSVVTIATSLISGQILIHFNFPIGYQIVFGLGFLGAMMSCVQIWHLRPLLKHQIEPSLVETVEVPDTEEEVPVILGEVTTDQPEVLTTQAELLVLEAEAQDLKDEIPAMQVGLTANQAEIPAIQDKVLPTHDEVPVPQKKAGQPESWVRQRLGLRFLARGQGAGMVRFEILNTPFGRMLGLLVLFHLSQYLPIPLFSIYQVDVLHFSDQVISFGTAMFNVTVFIGSVQLAKLTWKWGNKIVTGVGVVLLSTYPGLMSISHNLGLYLVTCFLGGLAWSLVGGALYNYLLEKVPDNDRPTHLAWYNLGLNAAILLGSLVGPVMAGWIGLSQALVLFALLRFLAGAAILRWG